jgi:DNA-binding MarR family transcriptional regulator
MTTSTATTPPNTTRDNSPLGQLLAAFQYLQDQNLQLASHLSTTLGIGPTDLRVMLLINATPGLSPKTLATRLDHTTGAITALVDRLENAGHLQRHKHPTDRRSQTLHLTTTGTAVVHQLRDIYANAFTGIFSDTEMTNTAHALTTLGHALHNHLPTNN